MIIHEAKGITEPVELFDDVSQGGEKSESVLIIVKDVLPPTAARGDMVKGVGDMQFSKTRAQRF